jgi:hypothetical protein
VCVCRRVARPFATEVKSPTLSQRTRQGWGTHGIQSTLGVPHPCRGLCDRVGTLTFADNPGLGSHALALTRRPSRFDFDCAFNTSCIVAEAAPRPILRVLDQTSFHGIAVDVAQFFYSLLLAPHVEIVVSGLPERTAFGWTELVRRVLLEHLQRYREGMAFRFADQQVDVFGHDHVAADEESVPTAHAFEGLFEDIAGRVGWPVASLGDDN